MAACNSAVRRPTGRPAVGVDATTEAQAPAPLGGVWAPAEEPAWFRSAVAAAFDAAEPAFTTAVAAALDAAMGPAVAAAMDAAMGPAVAAAVDAALAPAIATAVDAALAPAVAAAVDAALAASAAPGGALHSLFTVSSHNSVARAQNAFRIASGAPLMPLQSATGDIAPGFPATEAALMSLTGRALAKLLTFYGQPVPSGASNTATRNARLAAFRQFIGLY